MNRRQLLAAVPTLALAGCGTVLATRDAVEKRNWPMLVRRPESLPPSKAGRVLLVRGFAAAPGLDRRGLQTLVADGSMKSDFYEEWAVPPADGAEEALRQWLAASGHFSAVLAPGSRLAADLVLEGELLALRAEPARGVAVASIAYVLADQRPRDAVLLRQETMDAEAPLLGADAPAQAAAQLRALAIVLARIEMSLRALG